MIRETNLPIWFYGLAEKTTDDRGIYRIYGLPAGNYLVWAGGPTYNPGVDPYDTDVPTYAPSSTRDTATEITVRSGEETTNVDIRYRGEPGHIVSGTVNGPASEQGHGICGRFNFGGRRAVDFDECCSIARGPGF